jgi:hypothetical protein
MAAIRYGSFTSTPVVRFAQIAVIARRRGEWGKSTQSGSLAIRRREHAPKSPISAREPLQSPL